MTGCMNTMRRRLIIRTNTEIDDEGWATIEFPIGDDDMSEHSQSAVYEVKLLTVIGESEWPKT